MKLINFIQMNDWDLTKTLRIVLAVQLSVYGFIGLDLIGLQVPILRSLLVFVYLTFVPGVLILRILGLHKIGNVKTLLYSVGLSILLVMFLGYFTNAIYPNLGISEPLSTVSLLFSISIAISVLCLICYILDDNYSNPEYTDVDKIIIYPFLFLCLLPLFSIFGAYFVNYYHYNQGMMFFIILVAMVVLLIGYDKFIPNRLYPCAILSISLSLLLHTSLISPNINGGDVHVELYFFKNVLMDSKWDSMLFDPVNSVLSVTILPVIYTNLTGLDYVWVYKIIFPTLYSIVPLGLYVIFKEQTNDETALFSALFFVSISTFYEEMIGLVRQQVAEIFLVLLLVLVVERNISISKKKLLYIIFIFGIIFSHYSLSSFFFFIFLACFIIFIIFGHQSEIANSRMVILFFTVLFIWYSNVAGASSFNSIVLILDEAVTSVFTDFLNPSSRQAVVYLAETNISTYHSATKFFHMFSQFLIVIGVLYYTVEHKFKYINEFICMAYVSLIILVSCLVLPKISDIVNVARTYHMTLFFLSPFFVIGFETLYNIFGRICHSTDYLGKKKLISIYLVIFLFFNVGFVYEIVDAPQTSISLSGGDKLYSLQSHTEAEIKGVNWYNNYKYSNKYIYASSIYGAPLFYDPFKQYSHDLCGDSKLSLNSYIYLGTDITSNNLIRATSKKNSKARIFVNFNKSDVYPEIEKSCKIYNNKDAIILLH